jgi:Tol biopolymer transport system component
LKRGCRRGCDRRFSLAITGALRQVAREQFAGGTMAKNWVLGATLVAAAFFANGSASAQQWTKAAPAQASRFAPGIVARPDTEESMVTVSPDGSEIFWGVSEMWFPMSRVSEIWTAKYRNGRWRGRQRVSFASGYSDGDPYITYDGRQMFFASIRPVGAPRKDFELFVIDRTPSGYGPARALPRTVNSPQDDLYPSVTADGTLYFGSERSGEWKIYRARRNADGSYGTAELLPAPLNIPGVWSFNPYISRDGRSMLFTSLNRPGGLGLGDIWHATLSASGEILGVRNLGPLVNSAADDFHPTLSPDGKALIFMRRDHGSKTPNADALWIRTSGLGL